jgi:LAS superfamily LD-carboxypeptidase LdcB
MSIFRESFPDFIQSQIKTRQDLISGDIRDTAMRHLNSRSSWIRLTSSVDVDGTSDLAKNNVLFNGTSSNPSVGKYTMNEGFGTDKGTYKKGPLGFRPIPGIDSVSVKNKGAYGSLREVVINFKCWDIKQLEDLEVLYMRPGYTLLAEWGWSNYMIKDAKGNGQLKQADNYYDILNIATPKTISEITKELKEKIKASQGNYDAMFGKIKNYSWNARTDGGYDCTVTIISVGEVIESLKINNTEITLDSVTTSVAGAVLKNSDFLSKYKGMNISTSYDKNFLAGVFHELYAFASSYFPDELQSGVGMELHPPGYENNLWLFSIDSPGGVPKLSTEEATKSILQGNVQSYITLEGLCEVLNTSVLPRYNSPLKIRTKSKDNSGNLQDNLCIWNPLQISVDPSVCIITSPVWSAGVNIKSTISGSEEDKKAVAEAEKKSGSGIPDESDLAADAIDTAFSELIAESTNEDIVKAAFYNFIVYKKANSANGNRSTLEASKAIEELQKQYEKLRGTPERVTETYSGTEIVFDGDIDLNKKYWNFSGLTKRGGGIKETPRGIFQSTTTNNQNTSHTSVDVIYSNSWLKAFEETSTINFAQAGNTFDNDVKGIIESALKDSGCSNQFGDTGATLVGEKLSKETQIIEAQKLADQAQSIINDNKSIIGYISKLDKNFDYNEKGVIGNIYVNLNYLYKRITSDLGNSDRQERNEINLYNFLKETLKDIQSSIGNLNSFEIYVDDDHASIIDVNFSGNLAIAKSSFQIEVQNKRSVVRNYSLQSQIFPEQSSMISIAAQANQDALNTDTATLKAYSRGIKDRTLKIPINNEIEAYIKQTTDKYKVISRILSQIAKFFVPPPTNTGTGTNVSPTTSVSSSGESKNALRDLIQFSRNYFAVPGNSYSVIIPTKLSLTLDGLGGIVIGNLFRISDNALPKGYNGTTTYGNKLGYIVTDISQDVKSGEWTTTIGAQTIVLDSPGAGLTEWDYNKLVVDLTPDTATNENANNVEASVKSAKSTLGGVEVTNGALPDTMMADLNTLRSDLYTATKSTVNQSDGGRVRLYKEAMDSLIKLLDASIKDGIKFHINSSFRTYQDQVRIKADSASTGLPAATPGRSNHGYGLAIDFADVNDTRAKKGSKEFEWLKKNGKTYNFFWINRIDTETHHWEYRATNTDNVYKNPQEKDT